MTSPSGRARVVAKVGVGLPWHQRMLRIPKGTVRAAALGLWTACNCYSRGEELDGFCPLEAVEAYASPEIVTWLVDVGLLSNEEHNLVHGFRIHLYEEWNETKAQIEKRLRGDRKRQKLSRQKRRVQNDSRASSGDGHEPVTCDTDVSPHGVTRPIPVPDPVPDPGIPQTPTNGHRVTNATDDGVMGDAVAQWLDGVRSVTQKPFFLARGGPTVVVVEAILAHGPDTTKRAAWARAKGEEWARQLSGRVLKPHDFADWLNSGEPARASGTQRIADEPSNAERGAAERRAREAQARKEAAGV